MAGKTRSAQQGEVDPLEREGVQEGSRWLHQKPTGAEVAAWFSNNVKIAEGLEHDDYVQGVTLIPQTEKVFGVRRVGSDLKSVQVDLVQTFTPYAKVETRIAYFWDYVSSREGMIGVIEPAPVQRISEGSLRNEHLPPGFFIYPVQRPDGKWAQFLGCSMQVRIYERAFRTGETGRCVLSSPAGTKIVATTNNYGEDPNVVMKAETGAAGRALGMAGMLVLPGSGVATAEDMQEALSAQPAGVTAAPAAALPTDPPKDVPTAAPTEAQEPPAAPEGGGGPATPSSLAEEAGEALATIQRDHPERMAEVNEWAAGRKLNLGDIGSLEDSRLRGVVKKLTGIRDKAAAELTSDPQDA